jgi:hypothetical protein
MRKKSPRKLQQKALETLEQSTKTLEIAEQLETAGNVEEAERLRYTAREQRDLSVLLMAQAEQSEREDTNQRDDKNQSSAAEKIRRSSRAKKL